MGASSSSCPFRSVRAWHVIAPLLVLAARAAVGGGLFINPLRVEIVAPPGAVYEGSIEVRNDGAAPVRVATELRIEHPSADGAPWIIAGEDPGVISPSIQRSLEYRIVVPRDARGELRARISFWEDVEQGEGETVQVVPRIAVPIYVAIRGTEERAARIEAVRVVSADPCRAEVVVRNLGNVHIRPRGELRLLDGPGGRAVATIPVNAWGYPVLPGRTAELGAGGDGSGLAPGSYEAETILRFDGIETRDSRPIRL